MKRRYEIQEIVTNAVASALVRSVPCDADHRRRLQRTLLRCAARLAIEAEVTPPDFVGAALHALGREARTDFPATIVVDAAVSQVAPEDLH